MFGECKLTYLTDIITDKMITEDKIPPARRASSVPIKGLTDKSSITLTFVITLSGELLPMQVIYQGKTSASQPRGFKFPRGFAISQNPKHYSNEDETLTN